eukprot:TRINITY_DN423_c2_g1_i1.p1 TRINITY_DN423_c2_g1~~TRINITY_DN423_c2_g1_i1.p1  ORF type:complete len:471 (+),score=100.00 TRINITY_DN423_c2_g1_i1:65-1477(+)
MDPHGVAAASAAAAGVDVPAAAAAAPVATDDVGDEAAAQKLRSAAAVFKRLCGTVTDASAPRAEPCVETIDKSEVQFVAIGDWGACSKSARATPGSMSAFACRVKPLDFVLLLGDNFYPDGVKSVTDKRWGELWGGSLTRRRVSEAGETVMTRSFVGPYLREPGLQVPYYAVLGNHDYQSNPAAQVAMTTAPQNPGRLWRMPGRNYRFGFRLADGTRVDFFGLDTNGVQRSVLRSHSRMGQQTPADVARLAEELRDTEPGGWRFVYAHHPLRTHGRFHSGISDALRKTGKDGGLEEVMAANGVQAYFAGHEHIMQHHGPDPVHGGVHSFVLGAVADVRWYGGQKEVKDVGNTWFDGCRGGTPGPGFGAVSITRDTLLVEFVRSDERLGRVIHRVAINRAGERVPVGDVAPQGSMAPAATQRRGLMSDAAVVLPRRSTAPEEAEGVRQADQARPVRSGRAGPQPRLRRRVP